MENCKLNGTENELKKRRFRIWTERSLLERILIVIVAVLSLILTVVIIVTLVNEISRRKKGPEVCVSSSCVQQAGAILENMDDTVRPCDDFYQFACGSYNKHHALPDEATSHTSFDDYEDTIFLVVKKLLESTDMSEDPNLEKAKAFYTSCINKNIEGTHNAVVELLRKSELGEWPISDRGRNPSFDIKMSVLTAHNKNPFFKTEVGSVPPDFKIRIRPHDTMVTRLKNEYYFSDVNGEHTKEKNAYHKLIFNTFVQMGVQPDVARRDASDIIEFETSLANITRFVHDSTTAYVSLTEMHEKFPDSLDWKTWLPKAFAPVRWKLPATLDDTSIFVSQTEKLSKIFQLIKKQDSRIVDNYMMWRFVIDLLPFLDSNFRRSYRVVLPYIEQEEETLSNLYRKRKYYFEEWKQCVHVTSEVFRMPITKAFVEETFRPGINKEVERLVGELKDTYQTALMSQDWISKPYKLVLKRIMERLNLKIVSSEGVDDPVFKDWMEPLNIDRNDFVDAILQVERSYFALLVTPVKISHMSLFVLHPPLSSSTYFFSPKNTLLVSAGLLLPEANRRDSPGSLLYGGLGTEMARKLAEIYHWRFIADVRTEEAASKSDKLMYRQRTGCYREQRAIYSSSFLDEKEEESSILRDVVNYNVGLKAAFYTYQRYVEKQGDSGLQGTNMTNDQLFFVRFAQNLCELRDPITRDSQIRLNEILYNIPEFAHVFDCPPESTMNPTHKCTLWEYRSSDLK